MKSFLCGVLLVYQKLSVLSLPELMDWGVIFCGFYGLLNEGAVSMGQMVYSCLYF